MKRASYFIALALLVLLLCTGLMGAGALGQTGTAQTTAEGVKLTLP